MRRSSQTMLGVVVAGSVGALRAFAGEGFPAAIALSALDGTDGLRIDAAAALHQSGRSVESAGDINGDGVEDLIIGAPGASPGGGASTGAAYIVFGRDPGGPGGPFAASMSLGSLNGSNGFVLNGVLASDATGIAVAGAGDVNGDGVDDVIVGARAADPNGLSQAGATFVVFGRDTSGPGGPFPAAIELSALDGSNGFRLNGGFLLEQSGGAVASAGDVNDDGVGDVIIGAEGASVGGSNGGRAYIVFGRQTSVVGLFPPIVNLSGLNGANGFIFNAAAVTEQCAHSVACAGDVNGDGVSDLIIGAPGADPGLIGNAGSIYVLFGHSGTFPQTVSPAIFTGVNGFRVNGVEANAGAGFAVSSAGDVNDDGVDDVLLGAYQAAPGGVTTAGSAFVVYGRDASGPDGPFPATLSLAALDGANGFRMNGVASFDQVGFSVASGDVNSDGLSDMVIGAPGDLTLSAGQAYAVFGRSAARGGGSFPAVRSLGTLDGSDGFRMVGVTAGGQAGASVAAGDFNADGVADVFVGAYRHGNGGASFVVFGRGGAPCPGDANGDGEVNFADLNLVLADFNTSGAGLPGDVDGDGDVDFADLNLVVSAFNTVCP